MDEQRTRTVPMEVIGLGLCRTGTQTLADTLEAIGYGTIYHMRELSKRGNAAFWSQATRALIDKDDANMPGRAEFDAVFGDCRGACDLPSAPFVSQMLDAYPEARLILTTRSCESWIKSMKNTIMIVIKGAPDFPPGATELYKQTDRLWGNDFDANGAAYFHEHHRLVREQVAKRGRELLEVDVADPDALQKICNYLGKPVPQDMNKVPHTDNFKTAKGEKMLTQWAQEIKEKMGSSSSVNEMAVKNVEV